MNIIALLFLTTPLQVPQDSMKEVVPQSMNEIQVEAPQRKNLISKEEEAQITRWEQEQEQLNNQEEKAFLIDFLPVSNSQMPSSSL
ncbi:MAG: hypothetical protein AAFY71_22035 [Bacteroidota bacterium]